MKKYVVVICSILFFYVNLWASSSDRVCFKIGKEDPFLLSEFTRKFGGNKHIAAKTLHQRMLFSQAYLEMNDLTQQDKSIIKIMILDYLSNKYIQQLLERNKPNDQEAYSFYLLHQEKYTGGFEVNKEKIKEIMMKLKLPLLIKRELNRLENDKNTQ